MGQTGRQTDTCRPEVLDPPPINPSKSLGLQKKITTFLNYLNSRMDGFRGSKIAKGLVGLWPLLKQLLQLNKGNLCMTVCLSLI